MRGKSATTYFLSLPGQKVTRRAATIATTATTAISGLILLKIFISHPPAGIGGRLEIHVSNHGPSPRVLAKTR